MSVPSPLPEWFIPLTRYRFGLLKPRPVAPHITLHQYGWVLQEWRRFDEWNAWKDKGGPRPTVWRRVPPWVFPLRKELLAKRPSPTPPPPPPPPPPATITKWQRILFMGQNPTEALQAPAKYKVAFTADPGYDGYATRSAADQCRAAGHEVYVWFVPTEVSLTRAQDIAARLGANVIIGQGETAGQFDATWDAGIRAAVGNLSALREDQFAKIRSGEMAWIQEFYKNCQPGMQLDFKNLPVASVCVGVYGDGECHRFPLADYDFQDGWGAYGPGMLPEDYQALP